MILKRLMGIFILALLSPSFVHAEDSSIHFPSEWLSGTMPVLYITTQDSVPITSKLYYIPGTYYLDPNGIDGVEAFGSVNNQLPLEIRGRGNASWYENSYLQKPYKIKLDKKASLLGMPKSKHWALMVHWEDKFLLKDEIGFELSRRMNMAWTPRQLPIEVVINGDYKGLYFLTENVRVEKSRVSVLEQRDNETDPDLVTGGWLIENDHHIDEHQMVFTDGDGQLMRINYKSPENLSSVQRNYLSHLITTVDSLIYLPNKMSREWEEYIDLDTLVRFYIIHEMLDNIESFTGSCFIHKQYGNDSKLIYGPVWDFGNSFGHGLRQPNCFLYENSTMKKIWITELVKFPRFQQMVRLIWNEKKESLYNGLDDYMMNFLIPLASASYKTIQRWNRTTYTIQERFNNFRSYFNGKNNWLKQQWEIRPATLDSILSNNLENEHIITDNLYVAAVLGDTAYATDNNGFWTAIYLKDVGLNLNEKDCLAGNSVRGYATLLETNPVLLLDNPSTVSHNNYNIHIPKSEVSNQMDFRGNTVIDLTGVMHNGKLCSQSSDASISINQSILDTPLMEYSRYTLRGIIKVKNSHVASDSQGISNGKYEFLALSMLDKYNIADVNGDGKVDVEDMNAIINIILQLKTADDYPGNADLFEDEKIDVDDLNILINIILGLK